MSMEKFLDSIVPYRPLFLLAAYICLAALAGMAIQAIVKKAASISRDRVKINKENLKNVNVEKVKRTRHGWLCPPSLMTKCPLGAGSSASGDVTSRISQPWRVRFTFSTLTFFRFSLLIFTALGQLLCGGTVKKYFNLQLLRYAGGGICLKRPLCGPGQYPFKNSEEGTDAVCHNGQVLGIHFIELSTVQFLP